MLHCMCRHLLNVTGRHLESIEVDPGRVIIYSAWKAPTLFFYFVFVCFWLFVCLFLYPVYLASQNRDTAVKFTSTIKGLLPPWMYKMLLAQENESYWQEISTGPLPPLFVALFFFCFVFFVASFHPYPCPVPHGHNNCFQFFLGIKVVPREIEDNDYTFLFRGGGRVVNGIGVNQLTRLVENSPWYY